MRWGFCLRPRGFQEAAGPAVSGTSLSQQHALSILMTCSASVQSQFAEHKRVGGEDREEKKKQNLLLFTSVIVRPAWKQKSLNICMMKCKACMMSKQKVGTRGWSVLTLLAHTSSCLVHVKHTKHLRSGRRSEMGSREAMGPSSH